MCFMWNVGLSTVSIFEEKLGIAIEKSDQKCFVTLLGFNRIDQAQNMHDIHLKPYFNIVIRL